MSVLSSNSLGFAWPVTILRQSPLFEELDGMLVFRTLGHVGRLDFTWKCSLKRNTVFVLDEPEAVDELWFCQQALMLPDLDQPNDIRVYDSEYAGRIVLALGPQIL